MGFVVLQYFANLPIVIFTEYHSKSLYTKTVLNTFVRYFTIRIRLWIGNTLVFWFWRKRPILTHDLRSCISSAYHGIFFLVIENGRFLNMFIHFIYRPQMNYIFIFITTKSHIGSFADARNFFLRQQLIIHDKCNLNLL